jgi:hypothetical protein
MSNETKRDVFDEVRYKFRNFKNEHRHGTYASPDSIDHYLSDALKRYAAALPDDLPVIPGDVSEWIKKCKRENATLADTLCMEMRPQTVRSWMAFKDGEIAKGFDNAGYRRKQEIMATAWVLGVWRVEETGEIVKLEAEK